MNCSYKNMTSLPNKVLPKTEQLVMVGNSLEKLENLNKKFLDIKRFDFQNCNITYISENAIRNLISCTDSVNLAKNKLNKLPKLFAQLTFQTKLWLGGNPYECNCDMMWMRDWLVNDTTVMDKDNVTCGPGKWKGNPSLQNVNKKEPVEGGKNRFLFIKAHDQVDSGIFNSSETKQFHDLSPCPINMLPKDCQQFHIFTKFDYFQEFLF